MVKTLNLAALGARIDNAVNDLIIAAQLPTTDVSSREFLHEFVVNTTCSAEAFAANFVRERVQDWFATLTTSLSISLKLSAGEESFQALLNNGDISSLDMAIEWLEEYQVESVDVSATIRKEPLISYLSEALQVDVSILFLYEAALVRRLALGRLQDLVSDCPLKNNEHSVAIVVTSAGMLQSPLMTIAGLIDTSPSDFVSLPPHGSTVRAWRKSLSLRETTCTWTAPLANVPPDAFNVTEVRSGLNSAMAAMTYVCGTLSLLQFCATLRIQDASTWSAVMTIPGSAQLKVTTIPDHATDQAPVSTNLLAGYRLYKWAFRVESYDKIDIVRDLILNVTRTERIQRVDELLPATPDLLETARSNFRTFRHKAFEAYLQALSEARAAIQQFVESTQRQLDTLRHDVLDTTLKFSAAIVAFLAADVLKPGIAKSVATVGFGLGLIYLILAFVLQLVPLHARYKDTRTRAEKAVMDLHQLSYKERMKIITDLPPETGWTPFARWFALSSAIYGIWALILVGILVATR